MNPNLIPKNPRFIYSLPGRAGLLGVELGLVPHSDSVRVLRVHRRHSPGVRRRPRVLRADQVAAVAEPAPVRRLVAQARGDRDQHRVEQPRGRVPLLSNDAV